jgi:hypothetical protein
MRKSHLLYNNSIFSFKKQYYGHLLRIDHLTQHSQIHIPKFRMPGIEDAVLRDFWGYLFIKDGENYLIESSDDKGEELNIKSLLPIEGRDLEKVADTKGNVYYLVRKPVPKVIRGEPKYSVREFIDNMTMLEHTNPPHQKLLMMMAMSQLWDRSNYRVSSTPGFGKDSVVDLSNNMFGGCSTIETPTAAKLEERANVLKWLAVNEAVEISKEAWDIIQQFLLTTGAHKTEVVKRSRAFGTIGEVIDISTFSVSLFYNDIDCYPNTDKYFDFVTKSAVRDRFPAFRFWGILKEDFDSMKHINVDSFVKDNLQWYIDMVKSFTYYKENYNSYLHNYDQSKFMKHKGRDKTNMSKLLKVIDCYSENQKEFDKWADVVNESMMDYVEMLKYPKVIKNVQEKTTPEDFEEIQKQVKNINLFKDKILFLKSKLNGNKVIYETKDRWNWDAEVI